MMTNIKKTITTGLLVVGIVLLNTGEANAQDDQIAPLPRMASMPPLPKMDQIVINKRPRKDFADLKSKEVSVEVNAGKGADVYIENTSRIIEIKAWNEPKVKVVTTIFYEGDATKLSDAEWFEKLNLNVKSLGNSVRIKSGTVSSGGSFEVLGNTYSWSSGGTSGTAIFNTDGESVGTKPNVKRLVTIYLPKENKVEIESKYADITIDDNLNKLTADITNGNLDVQDVNDFTLRSKYSNVSLGNSQMAEIEFINGHFTAKEAYDLDLDTKYSTVDIASANKINLVSTNDDYDIEDAGIVQGQKNYGNLRISKLNKSIELDGTNADVKIRNIGASVSLIKLDNKYADMRLPLRNLKSYTVNYIGPYSTIYCNFEKNQYTGKAFKASALKETLEEKMNAINSSMNGDDNSTSSKFSATVGEGKGAEIDIRCQNCTVDFK